MSERDTASGSLSAPQFISPDFVLRKGEDGANGQDVARVCNEANLVGKQLWYFTVPANVPISVVQNMEIPMDRAQHGDSVISHDGQDYGISFDAMVPKSAVQIMIPSANGSQYQTGTDLHLSLGLYLSCHSTLANVSCSPSPSRPSHASQENYPAWISSNQQCLWPGWPT